MRCVQVVAAANVGACGSGLGCAIVSSWALNARNFLDIIEFHLTSLLIASVQASFGACYLADVVCAGGGSQ